MPVESALLDCSNGSNCIRFVNKISHSMLRVRGQEVKSFTVSIIVYFILSPPVGRTVIL